MCDVLEIQLGENCGANMGGTKLKAHYAKINDIKSFAVPTAPFTLPQDNGIIKTAHTMKTGKKFETIQFLKNSGTNNITTGGNNSGHKNSQFVFRVPSNNPQALFFFNTFCNGVIPLMFLVEHANQADGTFDQLGTEKFPATVTGELVDGENEGDGSVYQFTVTVVQDKRYLYTAAVPLTPGV